MCTDYVHIFLKNIFKSLYIQYVLFHNISEKCFLLLTHISVLGV